VREASIHHSHTYFFSQRVWLFLCLNKSSGFCSLFGVGTTTASVDIPAKDEDCIPTRWRNRLLKRKEKVIKAEAIEPIKHFLFVVALSSLS